jgi:hypothetical protein
MNNLTTALTVIALVDRVLFSLGRFILLWKSSNVTPATLAKLMLEASKDEALRAVLARHADGRKCLHVIDQYGGGVTAVNALTTNLPPLTAEWKTMLYELRTVAAENRRHEERVSRGEIPGR